MHSLRNNHLFSDLHGAKYLYHDCDNDTLHVWHGGMAINVYDLFGENIDCYSCNDLTSDNIDTTIAEYIHDTNEEV